jgi:hypothetical protein
MTKKKSELKLEARKKLITEKLRNKIGYFIKVDGPELSNIRVDLDNLSKFLISAKRGNFSVTKFERMLKQEMQEKLLGRPFTETSMKALCEYIDHLTSYLIIDMQNAQSNKLKEISKRRRKGK